MLKGRNYFKYEMKDTNQLMKQLFSSSVSVASTRSGEIKEEHTIHGLQPISDESPFTAQSGREPPSNGSRYKQTSDIYRHPRQAQNNFENSDSESQDYENFFIVEQNELMVNPVKKIKLQPDIQDFMLQKFYIDDDEQQGLPGIEKANFQKNKIKQLENLQSYKIQEGYESRKQRKGLANISLRVKNIVSEHKKLNYKQVSDLVLESSRDEISLLKESQRKKQEKNIKRRVYDALNVLVAVGILGKEQRCVTMTEWTDVPGKKLSSQWQKVNSKIDHLNSLKRKNIQKKEHLDFMIAKHRGMVALENKNRIENLQDCLDSGNDECDPVLSFPILMFFTNSDDANDKLTVQFQENDEDEQIVKVSGKSMGMIGDLDFATELDLQEYRDLERQQQLLDDLNNLVQEDDNEEHLSKKAQKPSSQQQQNNNQANQYNEALRLQEIENEVNQHQEQNNISKYLNEPMFEHSQ